MGSINLARQVNGHYESFSQLAYFLQIHLSPIRDWYFRRVNDGHPLPNSVRLKGASPCLNCVLVNLVSV